MLIKAADDHEADVLELERFLARPGLAAGTRERIEAEIRNIRAGIRAERDAAYQIELYFGRAENWVTIHDLRIEVGGLVAQVDHLIINRLAEIWVCESKSFAEGVSINEYGEWSRWWHGRREGMPSPVEQNRRHIHVLETAFDDGLVPLPRRFGFAAMKPRLRGLVLVSDNARISRPRKKVDGVDQVIKAEQLKTRLFDAFDANPPSDLLRLIGKEGLENFARGLAALHRPASFDWAARFGLQREEAAEAAAAPPAAAMGSSSATPPPAAFDSAPAVTSPSAIPRRPWHVKFDGPCAVCGVVLTKGTEAVWNNARRKMYCLGCAAER